MGLFILTAIGIRIFSPESGPGRPAAHLPIVDENEAVPEPHRADGLWGWGTSGANGQQVSARGKWGAVKKIFPFGLESKLPCCGCGELMGHMSYVDRMIKKIVNRMDLGATRELVTLATGHRWKRGHTWGPRRMAASNCGEGRTGRKKTHMELCWKLRPKHKPWGIA